MTTILCDICDKIENHLTAKESDSGVRMSEMDYEDLSVDIIIRLTW